MTVGGAITGEIGRGLVVLVGIERGDALAQVEQAARKLAGLRLFADGDGAMNLDLAAVEGKLLLVPNFTVAGSLARGRRPSFDRAARPEVAEPLIEALVSALGERGVPVATGRFGADMELELVNDGPVTFVLEFPGADRGTDKSRRQAEVEQLPASQLREELSAARLSALKFQLHPHFLFNTLHSISSLLDDDVGTAREMIAALSDLLRHTLDGSNAQEITLGEELETVDLYLAIERIRFQDRLQLVRNVEPETLSALVPSLLLQPLVENAIVHGVAERDQPSVVEIAARAAAGKLIIEVVNDEAPRKPANRQPSGVGLLNTCARLRRLYGDEASLELLAAAGKVRVQVTLPWHAEGPHAEEPL